MTKAAADISVIIRTLNEEEFLPELLSAIVRQSTPGHSVEVVLVDSGSRDRTLDIAAQYGCRILHIQKKDFTFGRSLNMGCAAATGTYMVMISGHCVPVGRSWLQDLIKPLMDGDASYVYGRQIGRAGYNKSSEFRLFEKYYPNESAVPQAGFFCNNANAALLRSVWGNNQFDEDLTGLEDMALAKQLVEIGHKIGYVSEAVVEHIHQEDWRQVRRRYEREALALQKIMPEVHLSFTDFLRYTISGILHDFSHALSERRFWQDAFEIIMFRTMQYWGSYRGNNTHRKLSQKRKDQYFYPG